MSAPYVTPSTRNVTRVFRGATADDIDHGTQWYVRAHGIAVQLSNAYGIDLDRVCGIIAALSPQNSWGANVNLANRFCAAGGLDRGYLPVGLAKGRAILAGADIESTLNGLKIINFYRSILTAGREGVCIDRHAYAIATNTRLANGATPSLTPTRYAEISQTYQRAARILSNEYGMMLTPAQVQSVTWELWRRRYWATGAFDSFDLQLSFELEVS